MTQVGAQSFGQKNFGLIFRSVVFAPKKEDVFSSFAPFGVRNCVPKVGGSRNLSQEMFSQIRTT